MTAHPPPSTVPTASGPTSLPPSCGTPRAFTHDGDPHDATPPPPAHGACYQASAIAMVHTILHLHRSINNLAPDLLKLQTIVARIVQNRPELSRIGQNWQGVGAGTHPRLFVVRIFTTSLCLYENSQDILFYKRNFRPR